MIAFPQAQPNLGSELAQGLDFQQFLEQCPEDDRYELVDGKMVRILATRKHYDVAGLIMDAMFVFILDSEGQYQYNRFQNNDRLISQTFPELNLTVEQIISA